MSIQSDALSRLSRHDLKVIDVIDQEDGTAIVNVDLTDEFMQDYMEAYELDEWSNEHFQDWFLEAIRRGMEIMKELEDNV